MSTRSSPAAIFAAAASRSRSSRSIDLLTGALATVLRTTLARRQQRQTERKLAALSDWQLKDIGLHRSHIGYLARRSCTAPIWRHHAKD
jgi:uncharacterized protein YjiS (DUF1127 family)